MIDQYLYLYQFVRRMKHPSQKFGEIRSHTKSDILSCLEKCIRLPKALIDQRYTTLYLMGVIVHLLKLIGANGEDNAQQVFLSYVTSQKSCSNGGALLKDPQRPIHSEWLWRKYHG